MRVRLWMAAVIWMATCLPVLAEEPVNVAGRATGAYQYPATNTICLRFETKEARQFLICDDVTSKEVIEKLFAFGKKDASCRIEGTVVKKTGEDVYLRVTQVAQEN